MPSISTHRLRKTLIRAASSPDVIKAMKVVQHSSPLITARYLENSETELDHLVLGLAASPTPDGPGATLHPMRCTGS